MTRTFSTSCTAGSSTNTAGAAITTYCCTTDLCNGVQVTRANMVIGTAVTAISLLLLRWTFLHWSIWLWIIPFPWCRILTFLLSIKATSENFHESHLFHPLVTSAEWESRVMAFASHHSSWSIYNSSFEYQLTLDKRACWWHASESDLFLSE